MKKFLFLMAMVFVIAGLMAVMTQVVAEVDHFNQNARQSRDVFYTEDFESGAAGWTHFDGAVSPNNWHVYDSGGTQGNAWWMGDPALASGTGIGGYHNHQYLVLDTPARTIVAGTTNLTFKLRYNVEAMGGEDPPYDGWDACNVRISTNNGLTWVPISGTPAYNISNAYSFGSEHGEGPGIPGWGATQDAWVNATFDLSTYVGSSVKIRFAFGSDPAYCTTEAPAMFGMMVDDIAFGGYSNSGVDDGQMTWASLVPTAGDFWHVATDASAPSPTHIMSSMNSAGTYSPNMLNYLVSPSITLPEATQIVADFQLKGTYTDSGTFPDVDYFGWEISINGGATWRYMSNVTQNPAGMNYVYSSAPDNWASMINSYTLDGDITIFSGMDVIFRWYFQSNSNTPNGTPLQIDNFQIFSVSAAPAPPNLVYPVNGAFDLPYTGFDLDWTASSLGALPEYYTVYMDQVEANLFIGTPTWGPTYISPELRYSLCNTVDSLGVVFGTTGERWYWRVGASVVGQDDAFSEIFRFDTVSAANVISTFPWNEGFEGGTFPPANWTEADIDNDLGGVNWDVWYAADGATYVHGGTKSAFHDYSDEVPDPGQNGWLITPPLQLPATGTTVFSFWNYCYIPAWMVYNGVKINTNNDPTDPGWVQLWTQNATTYAWAKVSLNLNAYAGQSYILRSITKAMMQIRGSWTILMLRTIR
jgi:hypothetical protein